jgi:hypothetical protein
MKRSSGGGGVGARIESLEARRLLAVHTWTGAGADNNWSTAANWDTNTVPQNWDALVFPSGAARTNLVNDLPENISISGVTVTGDHYSLAGNDLSLTGDFVITGSNLHVQLDVVWRTSGTLRQESTQHYSASTFSGFVSTFINSSLTIATSNYLRLEERIVGNGEIIAEGTGRIDATGWSNFNGLITVRMAPGQGQFLLWNAAQTQKVDVQSGIFGGYGASGPVVVFDTYRPGYAYIPDSEFMGLQSIGGTLTFEENARYVPTLKGSVDQFSRGRAAARDGVIIREGATIHPAAIGALPSQAGQEYWLIELQGDHVIDGRFANLADGQIINLGGEGGAANYFRANYYGGDGNDLTLVKVARTPVRFAQGSVQVREDAGEVTLTLQRSSPGWGEGSVDWSMTPGTATAGEDFVNLAGTITFAEGQQTATITIPILNDSLWEAVESFQVVLTSATGMTVLGYQPQCVVRIANDDPMPSAGSATIAGRVFDDANGNYVRGAGEGGLASWIVFIDADGDGSFDADTERHAATLADGSYQVTGLASGTYLLRAVPKAGWRMTGPGIVGRWIVTVGENQPALGCDFGFTSRSLLSGIIFNDANNNATRDGGEAGIGGVRVFVDGNANGRYDVGENFVLSNAAGHYFLSTPASGNVRISRTLPAGRTGTRPATGVHLVTCSAGASLYGRNFGLTQTLAPARATFSSKPIAATPTTLATDPEDLLTLARRA